MEYNPSKLCFGRNSKITDQSSLSCVVVNCTHLMQILFGCESLAREFTGFVNQPQSSCRESYIFSIFCVCACAFPYHIRLLSEVTQLLLFPLQITVWRLVAATMPSLHLNHVWANLLQFSAIPVQTHTKVMGVSRVLSLQG